MASILGSLITRSCTPNGVDADSAPEKQAIGAMRAIVQGLTDVELSGSTAQNPGVWRHCKGGADLLL
jgi:hypothetical protein